MNIRRKYRRIVDDHLDYLDAEIADYVFHYFKSYQNRGDTERCISYPMMADNVPSHSTARSSLTKATGPERTSLA